jgi:hypothetical protein
MFPPKRLGNVTVPADGPVCPQRFLQLFGDLLRDAGHSTSSEEAVVATVSQLGRHKSGHTYELEVSRAKTLKQGCKENSKDEWRAQGDGFRAIPEAVSAIQHSVASTFKKFHDLLRLVMVDTHFIQRFAKVPKKCVEMTIVQPLLPRIRMSGKDIFARIDDSSPEEHGDKHALPSAQVRHIGILKKVTDVVIRQDSPIKGLGSSPNCSLSTDEVIEFIDHFILLN